MDDFNGIEDFGGTGTYEYNPRAKRKPYAELAAAAQGRLPAKPVSPAAAAAAPAVAARSGAANASAAPQEQEREDMMGYGKIMKAMNSPEAWAAGMEAGTAPNEALSQNFVKMGAPRNIPYGGQMSWAEAASDGLKTGIGTYGYLKAQQAKAEALRKYGKIFGDLAEKQKEADLFSRGRGSGQTSVQGNPDYINDL
jgi:hypothetical protein